MTRRERRYLFIIAALSLKMHHLIEDTNRHLEEMEAVANQQLEALLNRQVEIDGAMLDTWQENAEMLWQEKEEYRQKWEKARMRRKEAKRLGSDGN